jgi:CRISPR-associated protein Csd2
VTLSNRYDMMLVFDCHDGNPNGDPDAGNAPRVDPETLHGLVSDVCQKRKVRDWIYLSHLDDAGVPKPGYDIFFGHSGLPDRQVLNQQIEDAYLSLLSEEERTAVDGAKNRNDELKKVARKYTRDARNYLCRSRFDVRTFGAVLSTGLNAGQVRGAVQCTFARSIDRVIEMSATITRKSVAKVEDAEKQLSNDGTITGTMGRKSLIPYGLYRSRWFVNPMLAQQTGFDSADFKALCDALLAMWELDRSASRGMMATQALIVFKHSSKLGNERAHKLFERVSITRNDDCPVGRHFSDYTFSVDTSDVPQGIEIFNLTNRQDYNRLFSA